MRQELRSLPKTLADDVAKNLVMVARLLDTDPEKAYEYSRVALRLGSRVAAVREAAGFASYATERYGEALTEFRAARRMGGSVELWPLMADCERGLGRPERALAMAGAPEVKQLDRAGRVEMRLVAAGARRDMGQPDAAVVTLQGPELASKAIHPWTARLRYAYADALLAADRKEEAREWFAKALEADQGGTTDASERLAELDGLEFVDALDPEADLVPEESEKSEESEESEADGNAAAGTGTDADPDTRADAGGTPEAKTEEAGENGEAESLEGRGDRGSFLGDPFLEPADDEKARDKDTAGQDTAGEKAPDDNAGREDRARRGGVSGEGVSGGDAREVTDGGKPQG